MARLEDQMKALDALHAEYHPSEAELRGAVIALGLDMTEWEDARYPADEVMLDSVVAKALEMREAGCPAVS